MKGAEIPITGFGRYDNPWSQTPHIEATRGTALARVLGHRNRTRRDLDAAKK